MAKKRKPERRSAVRKEEKTSNACPETTTGEDKIYSHTDQKSNTKETMKIEKTVGSTSGSISLPPKKENSNDTNVGVRRSGRLKSGTLPNVSRKVKNVVDQINYIENEKEETPQVQFSTVPVVSESNLGEEASQVQQVSTLPVLSNRNLEEEAHQLNHMPEKEVTLDEKVDYIVRIVEEYKSKTLKQVVRRPYEGLSNDICYKSLYFDSQKNIEALMEKHYELVKELEFAKGKIEAYEKMTDAMAASKEVILVSRAGKANEATVDLSPQEAQGEEADGQILSPKQKQKKRARS